MSSAAGAARLGGLAKAGIAGAAIGATVGALGSLYDDIEGLSPATDELAGSLARLGRTGSASGAAAKLLGADLSGLGSALSTLSHDRGTLREVWDFGAVFSPGDSQWGEATKRVEALDTALATLAASGNTAGAAQAFRRISDSAAEQGVSLGRLTELFPQYTTAAAGVAGASGTAAGASGVLAGALGGVAGDAGDAGANLEEYADALDRINGVNITAAQSQIALRQSFVDAHKAIDGSKRVTDAERSALFNMASQANDTAANVAKQTGLQEAGNAVLVRARRHFLDTAEAMGIGATRAGHLADEMLGIPDKSETKVSAPGLVKTSTTTEDFLGYVNGLDGRSVGVGFSTPGLSTAIYQAGVDAKAGLLAGIVGTASDTSAATQTLADSLIGNLRVSLDIHSPSRRAAKEVGRPLVAGVLGEVEKGAPQLRAYMQQLVDAPSYARSRVSGSTAGGGLGDLVGRVLALEAQMRRGNDIADRSLEELKKGNSVAPMGPSLRVGV